MFLQNLENTIFFLNTYVYNKILYSRSLPYWSKVIVVFNFFGQNISFFVNVSSKNKNKKIENISEWKIREITDPIPRKI